MVNLYPGTSGAKTKKESPTLFVADSYYSEFESTFPDDSTDLPVRKVSVWNLLKSDVVKAGDATWHAFSAPVRWKGNDWLKCGSIFAGVGLVSLADHKNQGYWMRQQSSAWQPIEKAGFYYGKPHAAIVVSSGFYFAGLATKNQWIRETGLMLGTTFIATAALHKIIKPVIGRARPFTEEGNLAFDPFTRNDAFHSFPSGHLAVATSISFVLAKRVNHPLAKAGFYALAGTTVISRMHSNSHWLSDMAMGSVITWFATEAIVGRIESKKAWDHQKNMSWQLQPHLRGLTLVGRFK